MNTKAFLADQLEATAKTIEWAIRLIPADRLLKSAADRDHPRAVQRMIKYFGEWSPARQLFHLVYYEEQYAIPAMKHWVGGEHPRGDIMSPDGESEAMAWQEALEVGIEVSELLARFWSVRRAQIELIHQVPDEAWHEERVTTRLGPVSAAFVVAKTIQHTCEHGDAILRNALYWDRVLERIMRKESHA